MTDERDNSGFSNSGSKNSGNWNFGNRNSGFFCTETPAPIFFDKPFASTWEEAENLGRRQCKKLPTSRDKIARGLRRKVEGKVV